MMAYIIAEGQAETDRVNSLLGATSAAVANAAAATAVAFPPGGTGTAAGGWDTAVNRDLAITRFAALLTDVASIRTQLNALLTELRTRKIISP